MASNVTPDIRSARVDEVDDLTGLALRSKAYWGYDEAFMEACRTELTITPAYLDANPTFVLEDGERVVGLYSLEPMESDDEVELGKLFVDTGAIRRGHGSRLFDHARKTARKRGYRTLWIQSDPDAEGFYRAQDAVTVSRTESKSVPGRFLPSMKLHIGLRSG